MKYQKMTTLDITAFIQAEGKIRFDQQLRLDLNWEETLDTNRLNHFLELANISRKSDPANLILNLGAGEYKDGQFYLNQTGVLFFAKEPTDRHFHISVVCALFKGTGKAYILDRKELTGNLIENIAALLLRCDYIEKMGSGIERIYAALEKENCPGVKITYNTMFTLEFPRPTYITATETSDNRSDTTMGKNFY